MTERHSCPLPNPTLRNLSQWDWSVNDADFCDEGGKGPTRFIYCMCQQTKPRAAQNVTFHGGGGYQVGTFPGNEFEWLRYVPLAGQPFAGSVPRQRRADHAAPRCHIVTISTNRFKWLETPP